MEMTSQLGKMSSRVAPAMIGMAALRKEYAELETVSPAPGDPMAAHAAMCAAGLCMAGAAEAESAHNRYFNVVPFDHHRAMLKNGAYVNASRLDRFDGVGAADFVVGIGPTTASVTRFWLAVVESDAKVIVNLARPGEVAYYHPEEGEQGSYRYTDAGGRNQKIQVSCTAQQEIEGGFMVRRELELTAPGAPGEGARQITITHLHFTGWPNYGVPQSAAEMAVFLQATNDTIDTLLSQQAAAADKEDSITTFVHCSGGVGRSGTFLSVLVRWRQLQATTQPWAWASVDALDGLFPIVKWLREQRHPWAVEGIEQYQFAYTLLAFLVDEMKREGRR